MTMVLVGNPKPRSRTFEAATLVGRLLTGRDPDDVLDLVDLGGRLLEWGDGAVAAAVDRVCRADVLVVACPTFKATYTGLLKLFLDQIPGDGLQGTVAYPVMLGAGPAHALAAELHLKPVLVELGATCPAPALYLIDRNFAEDPALAKWVERARRTLPRGGDGSCG
jgi:FMN reductase